MGVVIEMCVNTPGVELESGWRVVILAVQARIILAVQVRVLAAQVRTLAVLAQVLPFLCILAAQG
jgi:hypothetical protein